jgi:hypothetical protein
MKMTIELSDFRTQFELYNRTENFSYDGLRALFEYLEDYEDCTGEEIELDVIALCCDYTEYESLESFQHDYGKEDYPDLESIADATVLIEIDSDRFIIGAL